MKSSILTITMSLIMIVAISSMISAYSDDMLHICPEGQFFNEEVGTCLYCSECEFGYFERRKCTQYKDTVCSSCGAKNVEKNMDYLVKCVGKLHRIMDADKKYENNIQTQVMDSSLLYEEKLASNERIDDVEQLPDRRRLPPLPNDNDYDDQEYYEDEAFVTSKYGVPASEEELFGKEIVMTHNIDHIDNKEFNDGKKTEVFDFASISGDEFLRADEFNEKDSVEKDLVDDNVQPVNVNEAAIGQENEFDNDDDELLQNSNHIKIVAIAYRNKQTNDGASNDYVTSASYTSLCNTMGIYLYLVTFVVLLGFILKRCYQTNNNRVPSMDFTEDQRAMIERCAHNLIKKKKENDEAIYDNDIAYV